jgi:glycosyltransferase involved in cell wall biosynthesis
MLINASNGDFRHTVVSLSGHFGCGSLIRHRDAVSFVEAPRRTGRSFYPLALARMLRGLRPDLLLTYNWGAIEGVLAARLSGVRRVIHAEDGFGPDEVDRQKRRRVLARRVLLRAAARVVCPSRTLVRIATRVWRLPARSVRHIRNGVDATRFSPGRAATADAVRRRLGWTASESVVGTVGHLRGEKNHERLLRAFSTVAATRRAKLLIVGDGPRRERLGRRVRDLALEDRVVFTGAVSDPVDYYRAMDVFALSSDTEQMPIAVLEAMSVGLPIASTDIGDVGEMVSPVNRPYVVPVGRDDAYVGALTELVDNVGARARLGRANREKVLREYDDGTMIQAYCSLYREVLEVGR